MRRIRAVVLAFLAIIALPRGGGAESSLPHWRSSLEKNALELSGNQMHQMIETEEKCYFIAHRLCDSNGAKTPDEVFAYDHASGKIETVLGTTESLRVFGGRIYPDQGCFRISPSERYLAAGIRKWHPDRTDIALVDTTSKTATVLVSDGLDNRGYSFSPDCRYLLYYAHPADAEFTTQGGRKAKGASVRLLDLSSGHTDTILAASEREMEVFQYKAHSVWSEDGQYVVFNVMSLDRTPREGSEKVYAYSVDSAELRLLASYRLSIHCLRLIGPDRVLTATEREVDVIPLKKGATRRLLTAKRSMWDIEVEGSQVSYKTRVGTETVARSVEIPSNWRAE